MTADAFESIPFDALTTDDTLPPAAWLWDGYLMPGDVALLTSQWKLGKTTLLSGLLRVLGRGEPFLGRAVRPGRAWVVSEESQQLWAERVRTHPVGPHARLLARPFRGRPTPADWSRLIDAAVADRPDLFVVDPMASFLPGRCESDAATLLEALQPLHRLTAVGACVLLLHHPRKKAAEVGSMARGSGALLGFVDVTMELHRYGRLTADAHRRRLIARSRRPDTPARLDYEWDAATNVFRPVDTSPERQFAENWESVLAILREYGVPLTHAEILHRWPEETERPSRTSLFRWLSQAFEQELIRRDGRGMSNDPWRYRLETAADRERDRFEASFQLDPLPEMRGLGE